MKLALVQFSIWEVPTYFKFEDLDLKIKDWVIVEYSHGFEIGQVIEIADSEQKDLKGIEEAQEDIFEIKRAASTQDLAKLDNLNKNRDKVFEEALHLIKKHDLPMKLVDLRIAIDEKRLVFAFIADGRVDFRELVKELTGKFNKVIRLQQIGIRDEAKINGDVGLCGRNLCCQTHLKDLGNVSSEFAELQQVSHRGAERLSGVCGRLKCCLAYEKDLYQSLAEKMPEIGKIINTRRGKGQVIRWHVLKQKVEISLVGEENTIIEVPLEDIK